MRRAILILSLVGILAGLVWLRRAVACGWDPRPSVRFWRVHSHSPLSTTELDACAIEPWWFLDADLVRQAYAREEAGNVEGSVTILRGVERDAMAALGYRRADRFLLRPLDVARTRVRVAKGPREEVLPFLAARRALEEGRADDARRALRDGGPLAEEWSCLAGEIALATDPAAAEREFARWSSTRARWLLARSQRAKGDYAAALATLEALAGRDDLGPLADDVAAEIGRCHVLAGDWVRAARAYEGLLDRFPDGDMREEAEESLIYVVYRELKKARKSRELPPGVAAYIEGTRCLSACGLAWTDSDYGDTARAHFEEALAKGPAWLRDNALYRVARCSDARLAAKRLETLLIEAPDGPFAAIAHYLLAQRERGRHPGLEFGTEIGPSGPIEAEYEGDNEKEWAHAAAVCDRFPASDFAPAALLLMSAGLAEGIDREREAVRLAGKVLRAQPAGGAAPHVRLAMGWLKRMIEKGTLSIEDVRAVGFLDRYLLETGETRELLARCPESPFALRALVSAMNEVEDARDGSSRCNPEEDWAWNWKRRHREGGDTAPADAEPEEPAAETQAHGLPEIAERILARSAGADPRVLGFVRLGLARARLLAGDAKAARREANEALRLAPRAPWALRAWDVLGRADLALGDFQAAREVERRMADALGNAARKSELLTGFRAELAVALERAGDRVAALRFYHAIEYYADEAYLAEVLCTDQDLLAAGGPDGWNPPGSAVGGALWRRLLCEGRWDEARRVSGGIEDCVEGNPFTERIERTDRLEAAWKQVEACKGEAAPAILAEAERRVGELGSDEWEVRVAAQAWLAEIGSPCAKAVQAGLASPDAEVRERCAQLLERIPSDPAVALYRWATTWFDLGKDVDGDFGGDVRTLRYVVNFLSKEEGKAVEAFLEREHGLFRARRIYREVADRYPDDPTAAKALYMIGVCDLRLHDVARLYGVVGSPESLAGEARQTFLELVRRFPRSPLADDALLWASYFSKGEEAAMIRKRVVDEYPEGDVVKVVMPDRDWESGLDEDRLADFRAHNKALRRQGK